METKYKVGDKVLVVGKSYWSVFDEIGEVGTVVGVYPNDTYPYVVNFERVYVSVWFTGTELMLAEDDSDLDMIKAIYCQ